MSYRVLVIDDLAESRLALTEVLRKCDCVVDIAEGPNDALALAQHAHPRIVFLDMDNIAIDGYELAKQLRCEGGLSQSKLVALSALPSDGTAMRQAGIDHLIKKPIALRDLQLVLYGDMPVAAKV